MLEAIAQIVQALAALLGAIAGFVALRPSTKSASPAKLEKTIEQSNLPKEEKAEIRTLIPAYRRLMKICAVLSIACAAITLLSLPTLLQLARAPSLAKIGVISTLTRIDPWVFADSRTGDYEIGRLVPDRAALASDTSIANEINRTERTLDFFANNAGVVVRDHLRSFEDALKRGVKMRFILNNYGPTNKSNFDAFALGIDEKPDEVRATAEQIHKMLAELQGRFPTLVELRWTDRPILYTSWVRDARTVNELVHIGLHFYRGKTSWPSIRFSQASAPAMAENTRDDFDHLWRSKCLPAPQ